MEKKIDLWQYIVVKMNHHQKLPGAHPTRRHAVSRRWFCFSFGAETALLFGFNF
jgi:hypothetical protein